MGLKLQRKERSADREEHFFFASKNHTKLKAHSSKELKQLEPLRLPCTPLEKDIPSTKAFNDETPPSSSQIPIGNISEYTANMN